MTENIHSYNSTLLLNTFINTLFCGKFLVNSTTILWIMSPFLTSHNIWRDSSSSFSRTLSYNNSNKTICFFFFLDIVNNGGRWTTIAQTWPILIVNDVKDFLHLHTENSYRRSLSHQIWLSIMKKTSLSMFCLYHSIFARAVEKNMFCYLFVE